MRIHFVLAGLVLCSGRELAAQQPSQPVAAETRKNISVAFRFLTLGLGGEVARLLTDHVAARVGANYFKLRTTKTQSDITYDASLKLHAVSRSEEHTSELQSRLHLVCRLLLEKKKTKNNTNHDIQCKTRPTKTA